MTSRELRQLVFGAISGISISILLSHDPSARTPLYDSAIYIFSAVLPISLFSIASDYLLTQRNQETTQRNQEIDHAVSLMRGIRLLAMFGTWLGMILLTLNIDIMYGVVFFASTIIGIVAMRNQINYS